MKSTIVFTSILMVMLLVSCSSEKITINSPIAEATFERGSTMNVSWTATEGLKDKKIEIIFISGKKQIAKIETDKKGGGEQTINIPFDLKDGIYKISVGITKTEKDKKGIVCLSSDFKLISPTISITEPIKNIKIDKGSDLKISWNVSKGLDNKKVKILLIKGEKIISENDSANTGSGSIKIKIPYSLEKGKYRIIVKNISNTKQKSSVITELEIDIKNPDIIIAKIGLMQFFKGIIGRQLNSNNFLNKKFVYEKLPKNSSIYFKFNNFDRENILYRSAIKKPESGGFLSTLDNMFDYDYDPDKIAGNFISILKQPDRFYKKVDLAHKTNLIYLGIENMNFVDGYQREFTMQVLMFREPGKDE